jgi:hypothetical protein
MVLIVFQRSPYSLFRPPKATKSLSHTHTNHQ